MLQTDLFSLRHWGAAKGGCILSCTLGQHILVTKYVSHAQTEGVQVINRGIQPLLVLAACFSGWAMVFSACLLCLIIFSCQRSGVHVNVISCNSALILVLVFVFHLFHSCPSEQMEGPNLPKTARQIFVSGYLCLFPACESSALIHFGPFASSLLLQPSIAS